jgi:hypothetical protein
MYSSRIIVTVWQFEEDAMAIKYYYLHMNK